jgi:hypothetical protein
MRAVGSGSFPRGITSTAFKNLAGYFPQFFKMELREFKQTERIHSSVGANSSAINGETITAEKSAISI